MSDCGGLVLRIILTRIRKFATDFRRLRYAGQVAATRELVRHASFNANIRENLSQPRKPAQEFRKIVSS